jgi:hypothetical protein
MAETMKIIVFWGMVLFYYLEAGGSRFVLKVRKSTPEENKPNLNENSQLGQTVSGPRLELGISQIRIRCATHSTATFSNAENEDEEVPNGRHAVHTELMKLPVEPLVCIILVPKWKQENAHMRLINRVLRNA